MMLAAWWVGCGGGGQPEDPKPPALVATCEPGGAADRGVVIRGLSFGRAADGVSDGFDLDDSSASGESGCGIPDFESPDGDPGIDNAFAYLLPALELTEAAAVESLIQAAIDAGDLMITLELSGLDDLQNDDCFELLIGRAIGTPMVGTDGRLLPGQTLDRDPALPLVRVGELALVDGVFEAPFEISIPVTIFEIELEFAITDGRIRGTIAPDGTVSGVFAGGVDIEYLLQIALEENVDDGLHDILAGLLGTWADLAPDSATGECTEVSITFGYDTSEVFFFGDPETTTGG